jgi:penicillin-binding protein 1A
MLRDPAGSPSPPLRPRSPRRALLDLALVPLAALLLAFAMLAPFTPSPAALRRAKQARPSVMLSADGVVLARFQAGNQDWKPLREISPEVVKALVDTEDHRFYAHGGIDPRRIVAAAWHSLHGDREGGSTITQQLARNLYPEAIGNAPTLARKLKEAVTALKIEANYSKDEILETYLNTVPFLYNATGIEAAARTYFGKHAAQLDVLESATLVAMLKGTSFYNPMLHPERALQRRNLVLQQMALAGDLAPARLPQLQAMPLKLRFAQQHPEEEGPAPHLAQQVRRWLVEWAARHGRSVDTDGLVVRTTVLAPLQQAANAAVQHQLQVLRPLAASVTRAQPLEAGLLALDPRNGHVLAWVGSPDYATSQFDHVAQAHRQPGSTFKPFVYGAAFAAGLHPGDTFLDRPVTFGSGRNAWTPDDAEPPTGQPMTLADGLAYSRNRITAQVMARVGPARVARLARALGVQDSKLEEVPSLALGTSPVTLKEMVAAYAGIANEGRSQPPVIVTRVEDRDGRVLESFAPAAPHRALDAADTLVLLDAMRGVIDRGTGRAIRDRFGIAADVAGKTGTTQDDSDGWFILMHPQLVAGAWVGFDDNRLHMGADWGQGANSALPMVGELFVRALRAGWIDPRAGFPRPSPQPLPPEAQAAAPATTTVLGAGAAPAMSAPPAAQVAQVAPPAAADDDQDTDAEDEEAAPRPVAGHHRHAARHHGHGHGRHHRGHRHGRFLFFVW